MTIDMPVLIRVTVSWPHIYVLCFIITKHFIDGLYTYWHMIGHRMSELIQICLPGQRPCLFGEYPMTDCYNPLCISIHVLNDV